MKRRYAKAKNEIAASTASQQALDEARAAIERLQAENTRLSVKLVEVERSVAWANGRRADGVDRVAGYTCTETRALRIMGATGEIRYERMHSLHRHMSNIRKKLLGSGVVIKTVVMQGYEVTQGVEILRAMCAGKASALLPAPSQAYELRAA